MGKWNLKQAGPKRFDVGACSREERAKIGKGTGPIRSPRPIQVRFVLEPGNPRPLYRTRTTPSSPPLSQSQQHPVSSGEFLGAKERESEQVRVAMRAKVSALFRLFASISYAVWMQGKMNIHSCIYYSNGFVLPFVKSCMYKGESSFCYYYYFFEF